MIGLSKNAEHSHQPGRDRMYEDRTNDPYRVQEKWPEPTMCPDCGAIFHQGRWQWGNTAQEAEQHLCPACRRMRDTLPAGQLTLSGAFFTEHYQEIVNLIQNIEAEAKAAHPLERIMDIGEEAGNTVITFTDAHLAHGVGEALYRAYRGELHSQHAEENDLLRISWNR